MASRLSPGGLKFVTMYLHPYSMVDLRSGYEAGNIGAVMGADPFMNYALNGRLREQKQLKNSRKALVIGWVFLLLLTELF